MKQTVKHSKKYPNHYRLNGTYSEDTLLNLAQSILRKRIHQRDVISSANDIKHYLLLHFREMKNEVFCVVFLNTQHEILAIENVFTGTIDSAHIYPREVVRKVIEHNATTVVLAHNHPSGHPQPSQSDKVITERLIQALALIEVTILDHIVVGETTTVSFAQLGWI